MDLISSSDIVAFKALLTGSLLYSASSYLRKSQVNRTETLLPKRQSVSSQTERSTNLPSTRSILKRLQQTHRKCMVFYGTQTGTAEKLALRFAKEARTRYGLECLVADLDAYDFDDLVTLGDSIAVVFFLATYGEGEPTDNALNLDQHLKTLKEGEALANLQYAGFGLGSSSYQFFNQMIKQMDANLSTAGARRIAAIGLGDDGRGTMEDDYMTWKDDALPKIAERLGCHEQAYCYQPSFEEKVLEENDTGSVFLGEPNMAHLINRVKGPFTSRNPLPAPIRLARQAFSAEAERQCLHIEFDTTGSTLTYETGDHVAIWPVNAEQEVERFLKVFGLSTRQHTAIRLSSTDITLPTPIPAVTTYASAARSYLDICGPVSRQALTILALYTTNEAARESISALASDEKLFATCVKQQHLNIAQLLQWTTPAGAWSSVPFGVLVELIDTLKPRYYSISSSAMLTRKTISVTAVVEKKTVCTFDHVFNGVSTSYLSALCATDSAPATHETTGPRQRYASPTAYIHVRKSAFRLPKDPSVPIIMIGPGTGVAPFRAFVQERSLRSTQGHKVGRTMLFYGCRRQDEDFLYQSEWTTMAQHFQSGTFSMHTAFSRQPGQPKQYVQNLLAEHSQELRALLLENRAQVYVCGDASRMAKDVFKAMTALLAEDVAFAGCFEAAEQYLKELKADQRWLEDVW